MCPVRIWPAPLGVQKPRMQLPAAVKSEAESVLEGAAQHEVRLGQRYALGVCWKDLMRSRQLALDAQPLLLRHALICAPQRSSHVYVYVVLAHVPPLMQLPAAHPMVGAVVVVLVLVTVVVDVVVVVQSVK